MTRQHPERDEQAAIVKLLKLIGASVYVLGTVRRRDDSHHGTMQTPGLPDLYVILPGHAKGSLGWRVPCALWIEVKAPGGRPTEAQRRFQDECQRVAVWHILGGIDVVTAWLRQRGWIK